MHVTAVLDYCACNQDRYRRRRYRLRPGPFRDGPHERRAHCGHGRERQRAAGAPARTTGTGRPGGDGPADAAFRRRRAGSRGAQDEQAAAASRCWCSAARLRSAEEVRDLAALGVAGYVNEYSAVQHILPALAPHLFPDNFNRREQPAGRARHPDLVPVRQHDRRRADAEHQQGRAGGADDEPAAAGIQDEGALPAARRPRRRSRPSRASSWTDRRIGMGLQFERSSPPTRRRSTSSSISISSATGKPENNIQFPIPNCQRNWALEVGSWKLTPRSFPIALLAQHLARVYSLSSLSALAITISEAPMSAATAIHSVAAPAPP